jgi:3-carboxy-cis,cis-muconate cycloisomerase
VNPFAGIFVPDDLAELLGERRWFAALLAAERALVVAQADLGLVPHASAAAVAAACEAPRDDLAAVVRDGRRAGNPVEPLVRRLRAEVGEEHAQFVHRGATSQDILDSAAMIVARDASRWIQVELQRLGDAAARLADEHRETVMAARTLLQQAVPTTFGLKAAVWLGSVVHARTRLANSVRQLPAQLGGAAGTLASFGDRGLELAGRYAEELGLREPVVPWHTARRPVGELGEALAAAASAAAKIAGDIVLLAQTEVGEVAEGQDGVSSTMPHKRNPTRAVIALACERHARANAGVLAESQRAEHERAAGAWHAEWHALETALLAAGGAVAATADSLAGLRVDRERMRANVGDDTLSEARRLGIDAAAPESYLGANDALIDRALAAWRA